MTTSCIKISLALSMVCILVLGSCDGGLDEPIQDNPLDPENPEYIPPFSTILAEFESGDTLYTPDITIRWRGNLPNCAYSYRFNGSDWSDWSIDSSTAFRLLDELTYRFEVMTRYETGETEDPPTGVSFTVDAVKGPAYMLRPRLVQVTTDEEFSLELMAEEVYDFAISEVFLSWDPSVLEFINITIYEDSTAFMKSNGGTVIPFVDSSTTDGSARINVGVAAGNPGHVDGTGALFRIDMKAISNGDTEVQVLESSSMRNGDNTEIIVNEVVSGVVEVR